MAEQSKFNKTLITEIENNIGNISVLTDVGKALATVIRQVTAEALLKYTDMMRPDISTEDKTQFKKQSKIIEPLIGLMVLDKVVIGFKEELDKINTPSPSVQQAYESLLLLRNKTLKNVKRIGVDIKILGDKFNDVLSETGFPDLYAYGKTALSHVIGKVAGDVISLLLNQPLNIGLLVRSLLSFDTSSEEKMRDSTAGLLTVMTGLIDDLEIFHEATGAGIKGIPKFIGKYISPKTFFGAIRRATFFNIIAYIDFQVSYFVSQEILNLLGVYESEWYIDATDKILPALLNDLSGDKLEVAQAVNQLLATTFRSMEGKILSLEETGALFGSDEYKEMNYSQLVNTYKSIYHLITGKNSLENVKLPEELISIYEILRHLVLFDNSRAQRCMFLKLKKI